VEGEPIGGAEGPLSCFVEVRFRGAARRTVAVDSMSPIWNEQVRGLLGLVLVGWVLLGPSLEETDKRMGG